MRSSTHLRHPQGQPDKSNHAMACCSRFSYRPPKMLPLYLTITSGKNLDAGWKDRPNSFMWIHGKHGSGKSIMTSTVITQLASQFRYHSLLAYFFFDFQRQDQRNVKGLLKSVLKQIVGRVEKVDQVLKDLYHSCSNGNREAPTCDMLAILRKVFQLSPLPTISSMERTNAMRKKASWKLLERVQDGTSLDVVFF